MCARWDSTVRTEGEAGRALPVWLGVGAVGPDRGDREVELPRDLAVGVAERDQPQDVDLAPGEVVGRLGRRGRERGAGLGCRYVSPWTTRRTASTSSSSAASLRT